MGASIASYSMLLGLAACGGKSSSSVANSSAPALPSMVAAAAAQTSSPVPQKNENPVPVQLSYVLAKDMTAATPSAQQQSIAYRRPKYISTANTLLNIAVTPLGGATTNSSGPCTTTTCAVSFTANPGPNTLAFTLTDTSGHVLSNFSKLTYIQPSTLNTLAFTANPVVNSVVLQLASTSVNAGIATNDLLTVNAMDIDNKIIVGNSNYVDVNGNPVAFTLDVTNSQDGGEGTVTIQGPSYITAPNQTAIYAHYDGNWLASSTISVTSTSSAVTTFTSATLATTPNSVEYSYGLGHISGLSTGPDGAIWFTDVSNNKIGRINMSGVFLSSTASSSYPNTIAPGPDGNMWFPLSTPAIGRITPALTVTPFTSGISGGSGPYWVVAGPDGNMWFTEGSGNAIGRITTAGAVTEFSSGLSAGANPSGIVTGPDGNIWFAENGINGIGRITTSGIITQFTTGLSAHTNLICSGSDGNLWFTERNGNRVGRITPSGTVTEFSTNLSVNAGPVSIISGPDGNVWFGEDGGNTIGSITPNGTITQYGTGITSGASPQWITLGPDGNIWFGEYSGKRIGKFIF